MSANLNKSRPQIRLVSPLERAGSIRNFSITFIDRNILSFQYYPDYLFPVYGVVVFLLLSVVLLFFKTYVAVFTIGILGFIIVYLMSARDIVYTINRQNGLVSYIRGGVLSSSLNRQETQYDVSEIKNIVMQRHINRYQDNFEVLLRLNSGTLLPISGKDLSFADCQDITEKVRNFLGLDPSSVKAMD